MTTKRLSQQKNLASHSPKNPFYQSDPMTLVLKLDQYMVKMSHHIKAFKSNSLNGHTDRQYENITFWHTRAVKISESTQFRVHGRDNSPQTTNQSI